MSPSYLVTQRIENEPAQDNVFVNLNLKEEPVKQVMGRSWICKTRCKLEKLRGVQTFVFFKKARIKE